MTIAADLRLRLGEDEFLLGGSAAGLRLRAPSLAAAWRLWRRSGILRSMVGRLPAPGGLELRIGDHPVILWPGGGRRRLRPAGLLAAPFVGLRPQRANA